MAVCCSWSSWAVSVSHFFFLQQPNLKKCEPWELSGSPLCLFCYCWIFYTWHHAIPTCRPYIIASALYFGLVSCGLVAGFIFSLCTTLRTSSYIAKRWASWHLAFRAVLGAYNVLNCATLKSIFLTSGSENSPDFFKLKTDYHKHYLPLKTLNWSSKEDLNKWVKRKWESGVSDRDIQYSSTNTA